MAMCCGERMVMASDFEVDCQGKKRRLMRTWKKQDEE